MKSKILASALAVALALSMTANAHAAAAAHSGTFKLPVWFKVLGTLTAVCATSIIGAAFVKNAQQNKPLTSNEATTCGWGFWVNRP